MYHVTPLTTDRDITGILAPGRNRYLKIGNHSAGGDVLRLKHENVSSDPANRIRGPGEVDVVLSRYDHVILLYSLLHSRWHVVSGAGTG